MADHVLQPYDQAVGTKATVQRVQVVNNDGSKGITLSSGESASDPVYTNHSTTAIADNRKTVTTAGTAVQLITASTPAKWIIVTALTNNTQQVNVGSSTVLAAAGTSRGVPLLPGDSVSLLIDNVNEVYVDSRVNSEGVSFVYGS